MYVWTKYFQDLYSANDNVTCDDLKDKSAAEQQTEATHTQKKHNKKHTSVRLLAELMWS